MSINQGRDATSFARPRPGPALRFPHPVYPERSADCCESEPDEPVAGPVSESLSLPPESRSISTDGRLRKAGESFCSRFPTRRRDGGIQRPKLKNRFSHRISSIIWRGFQSSLQETSYIDAPGLANLSLLRTGCRQGRKRLWGQPLRGSTGSTSYVSRRIVAYETRSELPRYFTNPLKQHE